MPSAYLMTDCQKCGEKHVLVLKMSAYSALYVKATHANCQ